MPSDFIARPLETGQVMQAYPLVQALHPTLSPERWHAFAADALNGGSNPRQGRIMTLQTIAGYIHGLFIYRLQHDLRDGLLLQVDHLVTFELPGRTSALKAMIRVIEQLGREQRCGSVGINMPASRSLGLPGGARIAATFDASGYQAGVACWRKPLIRTGAPLPAERDAATRRAPRASPDS